MKTITKILLLVLLFEISFSFGLNKRKRSRKSNKSTFYRYRFVQNQPTLDGKGSVFYLDRQNVECSQYEAINFFNLKIEGYSKIYYVYNCLGSRGIIGGVKTYETPFNDIGPDEENSSRYLDRHFVNCGPGEALQQFRLQRSGDRISYKYNCVTAKLRNCTQFETTRTDPKNFLINELAKQNIPNNYGKVITGFKLNTNYDDFTTFSYFVKVCDLLDV